jgi:hypothetical protein
MTPFPYTIDFRDGRGNVGLAEGEGRAFKIYPLQEGQREPFTEIATDEEAQAWKAYQEAMAERKAQQDMAKPAPSQNGKQQSQSSRK